MRANMPWLKDRLHEIDKSVTAMAAEMGIAAPRIHEMIGGRRSIKPKEVEPMARALEWSVPQLLSRLPADTALLRKTVKNQPDAIPLLGTVQESVPSDRYDCLLTGETIRYLKACSGLEGRSDVECLHMSNGLMAPWRNTGDLVVYEKNRPPSVGDYVVIYLVEDEATAKWAKSLQRVMVRQLVEANEKVRVRQHNPNLDTSINRRKIAKMYRVMGWNEVLF